MSLVRSFLQYFKVSTVNEEELALALTANPLLPLQNLGLAETIDFFSRVSKDPMGESFPSGAQSHAGQLHSEST